MESVSYLFSIDSKGYYLADTFQMPELAALLWRDCRSSAPLNPWRTACGNYGEPDLPLEREPQVLRLLRGKMAPGEKERSMVCSACGHTEYPKISPAVIVAIRNGDRLLMSRYARGAYRHYALIAGYLEIGETFEDCVKREVMEEVGLKVKNIRYYKSQPWAFSDTVMIGFVADLDGDDTIRLQEEELSEPAGLQGRRS